MIYLFLYVVTIIAANFTASSIITLGIFQFAVGTLFFGAIFTLRDYIHNSLGRKWAYIAIGLAVSLSFIISLIGLVPLQIIIASIVGIFLSEIADTEIYHKLRNKHWILRILGSNSVSIPLDTILFTCIAFYGVWPIALIVSVIIGDIIVKFIISTLLIGVKAWKPI